ncbi:MAG TPA: iron-containing alcohol dehydrogenase, partial [Phyllobacterium sp.]|nr:iron-containing alcohol dehydrogenase [Phyllobacterium sp.]
MTDVSAMTTVPVKLGDRSYDILIGAGLIDRAGYEIASRAKSVRVAIVSDETVARLHLDRLTRSLADAGIDSTPVLVAPGEKSKSFATLETVTNAILSARLERGDIVIAFGGGVIGDLAGFAAGIARRGMGFIQ